MNAETKVYQVSGGELEAWADPCGSVMIRINSKYQDPLELGEGEVQELIEILQNLLKEISE